LTNREDEVEDVMLDMIPTYIGIVEKMSQKYGTLLLNLHEVVKEQLRHLPQSRFCPEPVHPDHTGHMIIANDLTQNLSR
jgi:lysophospholipase L1-like esterase